jgi:uncharacterized protein (TIGR01777 family)
MNVIVAGGTGFIGGPLVKHLTDEGHRVTLLSRNPAAVGRHPLLEAEQWDAKTVGAWARRIDGADAVINLAGELIGGKRWTSGQKELILNSRVDATRALVEAIRRAAKKPKVLVSASAVGYYGSVEEGEVDEESPAGSDFLATVCRRWEEEASAAQGVRVVLPRIGIVLEREGGALPKLLLPFKLFAGGPLGSGRQWFPWIHRADLIRIFSLALSNEQLRGPVNATAPESLRVKEFCAALGTALHRPSWAPVPAFILRIALGEMSTIVLTGQNAVPRKLLRLGFTFTHTRAVEALRSIVAAP